MTEFVGDFTNAVRYEETDSHRAVVYFDEEMSEFPRDWYEHPTVLVSWQRPGEREQPFRTEAPRNMTVGGQFRTVSPSYLTPPRVAMDDPSLDRQVDEWIDAVVHTFGPDVLVVPVRAEAGPDRLLRQWGPIVRLENRDRAGRSYAARSLWGLDPSDRYGTPPMDEADGMLFMSTATGARFMAPDDCERLVLAELAEYNAWVKGEVYEWRVIDGAGEVVESCGGYYGDFGLACAFEEASSLAWALDDDGAPEDVSVPGT